MILVILVISAFVGVLLAQLLLGRWSYGVGVKLADWLYDKKHGRQ